MDGKRVVLKRFYRRQYLLVDLAGDEHDERHALFLIVVLDHQVIDVSLVLQVLEEGLYPPTFFVDREDLFCGHRTVALQHIDAEDYLALFELLPGVSRLSKVDAVEVVEPALFVFVDIAKHIDILRIGDSL